jgi:hypothetical protein
MPQIIPIDLKPTMIKSMYQLMSHRIFHPLLIVHSILTQQNSILRRESSRGRDGTRMTLKCVFGERTSRQTKVFEHEYYHWTFKSVSMICEGREMDVLRSKSSFFHFSHRSQSLARTPFALLDSRSARCSSVKPRPVN